jgi:four helix bundle protein
MKASRFEDLIFWQKARELAKLVYAQTNAGKFKNDFGLRDQIQRSCVSVMSNIAEGFGRGTNKEMLQFLFIARGSLSEVKSQVYVAEDLGYITADDAADLHSRIEEIAKYMNVFMNRLKNTPSRGLKND